MPELELHRLLLLAFHRSNRAIVTETSRFALLPGQPKILDFLWDREGCTQREIGQGCALDKSTVTGLLARMEEQLLEIFAALSLDERVLAVEGLSVRPRAFALTPHGEISQTAAARIVTFF